jgi:hypothetical protein
MLRILAAILLFLAFLVALHIARNRNPDRRRARRKR